MKIKKSVGATMIGGAIAVFMVLAAPLAANATPYGNPYDPPEEKKVTICHNGGTLSVAQKAWENAHQYHEGDYLGECAPEPVFEGVTSFTPAYSTTCDTLTFSHPAFKGGFGESARLVYQVTVDGVVGDKTPLAHGETVTVPLGSEFEPHKYAFTIWAQYPGVSFDHQLGQIKGASEACAMPVPEKPGPVTVFGEWVTGEYVCGDTTVVETRTVTNVGHVLVDNVWVLDPQPSDRAKKETRERDLTKAEIEGLECETPVEPTEPPVEPTEPEVPEVDDSEAVVKVPAVVVDMPGKLAVTGSDNISPWIVGGALAVMGAGIFFLIRARNRTN